MKKNTISRVCVFCGSSVGKRKIYEETAKEMARALSARGINLVFGGGSVGLMGVISDEMLRHDREVIGIIPHGLSVREVAHLNLTELRVVRSMHERKSLMAEMADAFIALPGGFGTFEELFEIITWGQLGIHNKPIGILNVEGFYDQFLALTDHAVSEGFIRPYYRELIVVASTVDELLDRIESYEPPAGIMQWVELKES